MHEIPLMVPQTTLRGHLTRIRTAPGALGDGVDRVRRLLLPTFMEQPGSRHSTCVAHRASGTILVITCWRDDDALADAAPAMGRSRAEVIEATGALMSESSAYDLTELDLGGPHLGGDGAWSVVVTVEGLPTSGRGVDDGGIGSMLRARATSPGLRAACWLVDPSTGNGVVMAGWDRPELAEQHRPRTRRQRRVLEDSLRGGITNVQVCETFAAARCTAGAAMIDLQQQAPRAQAVPPVPA
jgi:hypothetical protein